MEQELNLDHLTNVALDIPISNKERFEQWLQIKEYFRQRHNEVCIAHDNYIMLKDETGKTVLENVLNEINKEQEERNNK